MAKFGLRQNGKIARGQSSFLFGLCEKNQTLKNNAHRKFPDNCVKKVGRSSGVLDHQTRHGVLQAHQHAIQHGQVAPHN